MDDEENNLEEEEFEDDDDSTPPFDAICRAKFLKQEAEDDFDSMRDTKWVFGALGVSGLKQSDAPSTGAWRMLHVLDNDLALLKAFYAGPLAKLLDHEVKVKKEQDRVDDERTVFALIDRLLREPDDAAPVLNDIERRQAELAATTAYTPDGRRVAATPAGTLGSV